MILDVCDHCKAQKINEHILRDSLYEYADLMIYKLFKSL